MCVIGLSAIARNARRKLKIGGKIRQRLDGVPLPQIAEPGFGYESHITIDRRCGFLRGCPVTSAAAKDGRQVRELQSRKEKSSLVWADTA